MFPRLAVVTVALVTCGAVACGLSVTGSASGSDNSANGHAEQASPAGDSTDSTLATLPATFACDTATCKVDVEFCCAGPSGFVCEPAATGCTAPGDGGGSKATTLKCTSTLSCPKHQGCCFDPVTGSSCQDSCSAAAPELCLPGQDSCGDSAECVPLVGGPLPGIGRCAPKFPSKGPGPGPEEEHRF
jgi:hypothetical protein